MSHQPSDSWIDARLRDVPLPPGLISRLRREARSPSADHRAAPPSDGSVHPSVAGRAAKSVEASRSDQAGPVGVPEYADQELDAAVRDVPVPAGFTRRLRVLADQEMLDEQLREIPIPSSLLSRLHVIPLLRSRRRATRWAVAACLMILFGGAHLAAIVRLTGSLQPIRRSTANVLRIDYRVIDHGPLRLESPEPIAGIRMRVGSLPAEALRESVGISGLPVDLGNFVDLQDFEDPGPV